MSNPLENKGTIVVGNNICLKTHFPRPLLENGKIVFLFFVLAKGIFFVRGLNATLLS